MLPWLHRNTVTADERDGLVEYAGRGRRKPKPPPTEIDSVGSAIEYFDITVLIGCARSTAASIYLADHDLISSTRRRRRTWRWTRRWRRTWCRCRRGHSAANRNLPHAATMRARTENPVGVLNREVKDRRTRQTSTE